MTSIVSASARASLALASLFTALCADGVAQSFGNEWLAYVDATASRLGVPPAAVSGDQDEIDFAIGDLDLDGFSDLVVVRKEPYVTTGRRTNLLLMNRNGVLQDETALYASASDVVGDQGFLTPTNDRDVVVSDIDGDGFPDIVTATALSFGEPKHISHPRVYRNLGGGAGHWLGLRHEDGRIPQFFTTGGTATPPNFCGVSAGDVTGDGADDLFFDDYDAGGGSGLSDLNDRLLVNDGFGFFTDQSALRMTAAMLTSGFGTSSEIVDINGDGANDVVKNWANNTRAIYNNPANLGFFQFMNSPYDGLSYHVSAGDLNNDGRLDLALTDDAKDRVVFNTGNDAFGGVIWGPALTMQFLAGADEGFGGNNDIVDLDQDGWNDVVIADVDDEIPGCFRRIHLYHNPGGVPGSQVVLREEREQAVGGWLGAKNLLAQDLTGGYDVAAFDIDNDGLLDLVMGRCTGTFVWRQVKTCQADLGFGGPGNARLVVLGDDLASGNSATLRLYDAKPSSAAFLFAGPAMNPAYVPELGGTLAPIPPVLLVPVITDAQGSLTLAGIPGGGGPFDVFIQMVIVDAAQLKGYAVSNAVKVMFLP